MKPKIYEESGKIWKRLSEGADETELHFELEVYRQLLNFFQVGDYYYFIVNIKQASFELVSHDITRMLGYSPEEVNLDSFLNNIHPEDQPWFLNYEMKVVEFFGTLTCEQVPNYKVRYDYRMRRRDGTYIRILHQVVTIHFDKDNKVLRTFGVHTDITHLKPSGAPVLSFIGLNGEPSYLNVDVKKQFRTSETLLTRREQEVLHLLAQGKSSDAISEALFISKQTVDTHRKNLLKKTECTNTAALVSEAVKRGWI